MNIYAIKGHKVKCSSLTAGYQQDIVRAERYLELDKEYTIEQTHVSGYQTSVFIEEVPNISFNSVLFEDTVEQSSEDDEKHLNHPINSIKEIKE